MPDNQDVYTYRAGQKRTLRKRPDELVVRALPDKLKEIGIADAEQVSSASSRVTTRAADLEALMSRCRHMAPTHHAYSAADTGEEFLIADWVFVTFCEALPAEEVGAFAGRYGLILLEAYSDREYLFQLTDATGMNPVKLVVRLTEQEPQVESAEHDLNQRMSTYQVALPADPSYAQQWHLHTRFSHPGFDPRASPRCEAWQLLGNYGSGHVVVGVTDDGCKLDHPDSPGKFAGWACFRGRRLITNADIDANPAEMYKPGANHGTSCAGVIAAELDALLTVGAAPGCRLLPIQWKSSGPYLLISDSKMLTALNYVADKVDILSNSWGSAPVTSWIPSVRKGITSLAQAGGRRGRGIVFVWAVGNENCPIQHIASVDVPYTGGWDQRIEGEIDALVELAEAPGRVRAVEVSVDITHSFIGDLLVALVSPSGTNITLHHRTGGAADNIIATYTPVTAPALQGLRGEIIKDAWTVKAADLARRDVGKLNQWAVRIVSEP